MTTTPRGSRAALTRAALLRGVAALPVLSAAALSGSPSVSADVRPATSVPAPDRYGAVLRAVRGPVLRPSDPGFAAEVAGFNVAHSPAPRLVVGATCAADVEAAVRYARLVGARVAVQATGHGLSGDLAGTVLVTTRRLAQLAVDPVTRTATVGAGLPWRAVVDAAAPHGLAPLVGSSSHVGAVGFSLGGGVGPLSRRYGFAADRVRSLEVVTADGRRRTVDDRRHDDLFWALRGARDGLAVVTSVVVDLVPVARVHGGGVFFDGASAREVLHAWRSWAPTLPEDASTSVALLRLPPDPSLPEPLRGRFVAHLRFTHTGPAAEAQALLAPVRTVAPVLLDTVGELPFAAIDAVHADPTSPLPYAETGTGLGALPAAAVDAVLAQADAASGSALTMVELRLLGGAMTRPAAPANAATGRAAAFSLLGLGVLAGPGAAVVPQQLAALRTAVAPWSCPGPLNLAGPGRHDELWSAADRERLARVRRRWDPRGVLA